MPVFYYKAIDVQGSTKEGEIEGSDTTFVISQLQEAGFIPIRVEPAAGRSRLPGSVGLRLFARHRVTRQQVMEFTRELSILLAAGLSLDRCLQILMDLTEDEVLRSLILNVYDRVRGGSSFSAAVEAQEGVFPPLYVNMLKAGEAAGALDTTLAQLAEYLERVKELKDSVISALIYPTILIVVAGISVIILLAFVVPQFTQMFQDMGAALPLPTQIVIAVGEGLRMYWWSIPIVVLFLAVTFRHLLGDPERRLRWDRWMLRWPLVGDLVTKVEVARLTRTLGMLLGNGVPVLGALGNAKDVLNNQALSQAIGNVSDRVQEGKGLAEPLAVTGIFPKLAVQMIQVGEESGQLQEMLVRVADVYDREVKTTLQRLLALLEPLLIVGLGILIAGIIVSIMIAVLSVNQLVF